jgi:hypothetical protein
MKSVTPFFFVMLSPEKGNETLNCFGISGEYTSIWIPLQPTIQQVDNDGTNAT